ncbi:PaaX family transcriptional regulator C-terminal domain-containing protein [Rhodococcus sp. G-MC3]|uniref:PaaX family transcriptional regulator n=1 Tax=Rhodococcus sp. G-MC3 TaxID=3046209 RepID=UPI0024BAE2F5|nr:PaaX family transcriptional regulator C-terminal domain-containing protein [Rhodococcus sp. G-MC3]MDJ0396491.1 PaaX family transcriptional regulator C-terminal domain-containing protein [Rhodococcus sp. G-MC3]
MQTSPPAESRSQVTSTPQSLLLAFLGMHLLRRPIAISGASIVDVFGWLGVGQSATRSLLARMTDRGMLERSKKGRNTYYALTPKGSSVLDEGSSKVWRGVGDAPWDGQWTTIALSVPEDSRHLRHRARSRLGWSGFGNTASGLWVAPRRHDVQSILGADFDDIDITVLVGRTEPPTTDESLVAAAYDLNSIATRYSEFTETWNAPETKGFDARTAFATRIRLQSHWLSLGRADPLLPASLLPPNWPAAAANTLFRTLDAALDRASVGIGIGNEIEARSLESIALEQRGDVTGGP